jgi:uncharacterized OsmC-like protein/dienelactone hydrolase
MTTDQTPPNSAAANLLMPSQPPRAVAIYAHRHPPKTGPQAASAIPSALAASGIAVLALDLGSSPPRSNTPPAGDGAEGGAAEHHVAAVRSATERLRATHGMPSLLIGHSAAGPVILAAAASLTDVRAVVTIGSPAPRSRRLPHAPLLVLHAPGDQVVSIHEAGRLFAAAHHPKSFIALDGADHAVSEPRRARHVAGLITAWAEPYLPDPPSAPVDPAGWVVVTDAGTGKYTQRITAGHHLLIADEPVSVGGSDAGPNPYDLLLAALGACTSMTLRMYADRKGLPLHRTTVRLRHDRVHAKDCAQTEQDSGMLTRIRREIDIEGPLSDQERQRLVEIADRCPVHRTLSAEIAFETTEA